MGEEGGDDGDVERVAQQPVRHHLRSSFQYAVLFGPAAGTPSPAPRHPTPRVAAAHARHASRASCHVPGVTCAMGAAAAAAGPLMRHWRGRSAPERERRAKCAACCVCAAWAGTGEDGWKTGGRGAGRGCRLKEGRRRGPAGIRGLAAAAHLAHRCCSGASCARGSAASKRACRAAVRPHRAAVLGKLQPAPAPAPALARARRVLPC